MVKVNEVYTWLYKKLRIMNYELRIVRGGRLAHRLVVEGLDDWWEEYFRLGRMECRFPPGKNILLAAVRR